MSVWIQNLQMALETKGILLIHGNVRDHYIDTNCVLGSSTKVFRQLTPLLRESASRLPVTFHDFVTYSPFKAEIPRFRHNYSLSFGGKALGCCRVSLPVFQVP